MLKQELLVAGVEQEAVEEVVPVWAWVQVLVLVRGLRVLVHRLIHKSGITRYSFLENFVNTLACSLPPQ